MKNLGPTASQLLTRLAEQGHSIFTIEEVRDILKGTHHGARKLVSKLVGQNWLKRLERGRYLIVPLGVTNRHEYTTSELLIAAHFVSPYYISWWTALHHYGLTEQVSRKVYIGTLTQKKAVTISGVTYQFVTISKQKFFGVEDVWVEDQKVKMAGREKMLVDCLDRPDLCGGIVEAAKGLWNSRDDLDFSLLVRSAIKMKKGAVRKRLGYLLQYFQLGDTRHRRQLKKDIPTAYSLLDPNLRASGRCTADWNLRLNVRDEDLRSWQKT